MTPLELIIRISLSFVLGGLIGAERQWRQRNAGLRTNTLVCVGSALFVSLSFSVEGEMSPTRVAAQVVSGIGFLGGGVILREGLNIRGLNTAATLWCSAATGSLCGAGFLFAASIGGLAILTANVILRPVATRLNRNQSDDSEDKTEYSARVECARGDEIHVRGLIIEAVRANQMSVRALVSNRNLTGDLVRIQAEIVAVGQQDAAMDRVFTRMSLQEPIISFKWRSKKEQRSGI